MNSNNLSAKYEDVHFVDSTKPVYLNGDTSSKKINSFLLLTVNNTV